jgi:hypothetical protein
MAMHASKIATALMLCLVLGACSAADGDDATSTTSPVPPSDASVAQPTSTSPDSDATSAQPDTTVAREPDATTTTSSEASNTSTTTAPGDVGSTTTTLPQTSTSFITVQPDGLILRVEPYARLADVPFGTEADVAIPLLVDVLGEPDVDTGWIRGCPLDGDEANERNLTWGSLQAQFFLNDTGRLVSWTYDTRRGEVRPDAVTGIDLPGGAELEDAMADVAAGAGADLVIEPAFDAAVASVDGYTLWGFPANGGAPLALIGVPFVAFCE